MGHKWKATATMGTDALTGAGEEGDVPSSIFSCSSQERLLVLHNKHAPNLRASEQACL